MSDIPCCAYDNCLVRNFKHYHIDENTVRFTSQDEQQTDIYTRLKKLEDRIVFLETSVYG